MHSTTSNFQDSKPTPQAGRNRSMQELQITRRDTHAHTCHRIPYDVITMTKLECLLIGSGRTNHEDLVTGDSKCLEKSNEITPWAPKSGVYRTRYCSPLLGVVDYWYNVHRSLFVQFAVWATLGSSLCWIDFASSVDNGRAR